MNTVDADIADRRPPLFSFYFINMKKLAVIVGVILILFFLTGCKTKEERYEECMRGAFEAYSLGWDEYCTGKGLGKDCSLPANTATRLNESLGEYEDRCLAIRLD